MRNTARPGAVALIETLRANGVGTVFCVPGESYLAALDALYDARHTVRLIVCRQEGGAAYMAEAWGKLTGRPGVCFVTRGPGACNAAIGVHLARQDSTPMILFVGQVARGDRHREAFQEIDTAGVFGSLAKWAADVDRAERVPELVSRAFATAMQGRPGPVVLGLPEDMLVEPTDAAVPPAPVPPEPHPSRDEIARLGGLLDAARRPLLLVGGGGWTAAAAAAAEAFATRHRLPVAASFRCADYVDNDHPGYAGDLGLGPNPKLASRAAEADLLLAVGPRLGEITTQGYALPAPPRSARTLVHVHRGAEELNAVYRADLAIQAGAAAFFAAAEALPARDAPAWAGEAEAAHAAFLDWQAPQPNPGPVQLGDLFAWLRGRLPPEAIVANGAGNYAGWVGRHHRFRRWRTQLAPTAGSMGYGVPAAIAAKLARPDSPVVSVNGDGCFLMNGQELATAAQYGLGIVVLVVDNGMYGTIRMHQERHHPGRAHGTDLVNPDFAALARSYGAFAATVDRTEDFAPAFEAALAAGGPALIHIRVDPEAITSRTTLSAVRAAAGRGA
jgi:acetolactate synthase-1/2/3 large subunit